MALSRRDDLESLFFMLLYLSRGELPWQPVKDLNAICEWKGLARLEGLCRTSGVPWYLFMDHCRKLGFAETPDYSLLRRLLQDDSSCGSSGLLSRSMCFSAGESADGNSIRSDGFPSSEVCGHVFPNPCKISL